MITSIDFIVNYCQQFQDLTGWQHFIPCRHQGTKKPPVIAADYGDQINQFSAEQLLTFERVNDVRCVGIYLGDRFVVLDCDDLAAVEAVETLEGIIEPLPYTLSPTSDPGKRGAYIFEVPKPYRGKIVRQDINKLQILTGKAYQIIVGSHPSGREYSHQTEVIKPAMLPIAWCDLLTQSASHIKSLLNSKSLDPLSSTELLEAFNDENHSYHLNGNGNNNGNGNGNGIIDNTDSDLSYTRKLINSLLLLEYPTVDLNSRDNRFRLGGIIHSIDSSNAGFELCCEVWMKHESFDPDKSLAVWKSYKDKPSGATLGSLKYWLKQALEVKSAVMKLEPSKVAEIRELANNLKLSEVPLREMFNDLEERLIRSSTTDRDYELYLIAEAHRKKKSEIDEEWHIYQQKLDIERNRDVYKRILDAVTISTNNDSLIQGIFRQLPGGEKIISVLREREYDLFTGLMFYITTCSSALRKDRVYEVSGRFPTSPVLFTIVNCESGRGKSPFIQLFTREFEEWSITADMADEENLKTYKKSLTRYKDLGKNAKHNATPPVYIKEVSTGKYEADTSKAVDYIAKEPVIQQPQNFEDLDNEKIDTSEETKQLPVVEQIEEPNYEPEEPEPLHRYVITEGTPEGIRDLIIGEKKYNVLWFIDELSDLFKQIQGYNNTGRNQYSDNALFIKIWEGKNISVQLAGRKVGSGKWRLSLIAGVQPEVLKSLMDLDDHSGATARFIFIDGEHIKLKHINPNLPDDRGRFDDVMIETFKKLRDQKGGKSKASNEAFDLWEKWDEQIMYRADHEITKVGFKYWLRKISQNVARIAGILHDLKVANGVEPNYDFISGETMHQAISIGNILVDHHSKLYDAYNVPDNVDPELLKQMEAIKAYLLKREGTPVSIYQIRGLNMFRNAKPKPIGIKEIQPIVDQMIQIGKIIKVPGGYVIAE